MSEPVSDALCRVAGAYWLTARGARLDLIGREDRLGLVRAGAPVLLAHQAPRLIGAAQMV